MKKVNRYIFHEELKAKMMKDPEFKKAYDELEPQFQIIRQILDARLKKNITQKELADRIGTGQAVISRLESPNARPSISLLQRVAKALNTKFHITIG